TPVRDTRRHARHLGVRFQVRDEVTSMTRSSFVPAALALAFVLTSAPAHAQVVTARGLAARGFGQGATTGFSVVLVLGDSQGGGASESVPASAAKALADLKDFLPYRSYQL